MKYRVHYANGTIEEVITDETREQLLAQAKPILDVVLLDILPTAETLPEPVRKPRKKAE